MKHIKIYLISLITGICGGIVGGIFHKAVEWATEIRHENSYIITQEMVVFRLVEIVFLLALPTVDLIYTASGVFVERNIVSFDKLWVA